MLCPEAGTGALQDSRLLQYRHSVLADLYPGEDNSCLLGSAGTAVYKLRAIFSQGILASVHWDGHSYYLYFANEKTANKEDLRFNPVCNQKSTILIMDHIKDVCIAENADPDL